MTTPSDAVHRFPRVAIVSANPLRPDASNGILMGSLFGGWPRDRLAQIYFRVLANHPPHSGACDEFRMIDMCGRVHRPTSTHGDEATAVERPAAMPAAPPRRRSVSQALELRPRLGNGLKLVQEAWYGGPWIGRALRRQLHALQPDIVYALLGRYHLTKITYLACRDLRLPLYVHVADDFATAWYRDFPLAARLQEASAMWFGRAVAYAEGRAAAGPTMADAFAGRFDNEWDWFTTLVDPRAYDASPPGGTGRLRLVYAGSLAVGRWRPLRRLGHLLAELRGSHGVDACLTIHAPPEQIEAHRASLAAAETIVLAGWAPPDELPRIFHAADALVHVESNDPEYADYTRLSLSTKIAQYMMAGRCIIAIGPAGQGSVKTILEAGAGLALDEPRSPSARSLLAGLLLDSEARDGHGRAGREWALRWVAREPGRERFRSSLHAAWRRSRESRGGQPPAARGRSTASTAGR